MSDLQANTYALKGGTPIERNSDMNTYNTPGNYYCVGDSIAQTLINCPFTHAFTLKVYYGNGIGYQSQTFTEYNTGNIATRFYNPQPGINAWSEYKYLTPTTQS